MKCLAATVHDGHIHHCTIEPAPHPTDITHMAPCDGGKRLYRWKDPELTTTTDAPPERFTVEQVAHALDVPAGELTAPLKTVCAAEAPSVPAVARLLSVAAEAGWHTEFAENTSTKVVIKVRRGSEHGHASWEVNGDGKWRFSGCLISGQRYGAREIPTRLARPVEVPKSTLVQPDGSIGLVARPVEGDRPLATVTPIRPETPTSAAQAATLAPPPPATPAVVLPTGTLATFMAAAPGRAEPVNGNTPWANRYAAELREIIHYAGRNSARNLQVHLGPSELGVPCDRQVAGKLAGIPATNHVSDPWPSIVGTAVHAWLADAFKAENARHGLRWVPEHRVIPHPDHSGTADLYDGREQAVVDWKNLSADSLDKIAAKGPSIQYQIQLLLYGRGYRNLGLPVRRVVLVALPRTKSSLNGMYVWDHELTPADDDAIEEVFRLTAIRKQIADEIRAGRPLLSVPATPDSDTCYFCPFYRPNAAQEGGGIGCPGTVQ